MFWSKHIWASLYIDVPVTKPSNMGLSLNLTKVFLCLNIRKHLYVFFYRAWTKWILSFCLSIILTKKALEPQTDTVGYRDFSQQSF